MGRQIVENLSSRSHFFASTVPTAQAPGRRYYDDYCGFGRQLDRWLQANHAQAWFEHIEVDDEDAGAIARWQRCMAMLGGGEPSRIQAAETP